MWRIHKSAVYCSSERTSFPPLQNGEKVSLFFQIKGSSSWDTVWFLDSHISPNIIMTTSALLSIIIQKIGCFSASFLTSNPVLLHKGVKEKHSPWICSGHREGAKMSEEISTQGYCVINKIFSCISQGTEGFNTLMWKMAKGFPFKSQSKNS